jgi:hypothetical protein
MPGGMRVIIAVICAALCLDRAAAATDDIPVAERPEFHSGDVLEYVERFQTVACRAWEFIGGDGDTLQSRCGDNTAYFAADSGALLRISGKNGRDLVKFEPFSPAIPFPLQVGSKWGGRFQVTTAGDLITPRLDESCEVTAFETVKVAAGELPAFRFACVTKWSVWPLSGTVTVTSWYSPAAKSVVKSENPSDPKWNLELASYRLQ